MSEIRVKNSPYLLTESSVSSLQKFNKNNARIKSSLV